MPKNHVSISYSLLVLLVLNVGNGWVAGGCWDDDITRDEMDHSRKFPAFSTSKPMCCFFLEETVLLD